MDFTMTSFACLMVVPGGSRSAPWWVCCPCVPPQSSSRGSANGYQRRRGNLAERLKRMPELLDSIHPTGPGHFGYAERGIAALVNENRLRRILTRMLDENEFLSDYGIRALSKYHDDHPFIVHVEGQEYRVNYLPAESEHGHVRR